MVFDIVLMLSAHGAQHFIPYKQVVAATARHGLFYGEPLMVGSYQQCLEYSPRFRTTIPSALHRQRQHPKRLPELLEEADANLAEGIVIKPYDVPTSPDSRPILKIKIAEFSELPSGSPPDASTHAFREYVLSLMNANRLAAATSKIGPPSRRELWGEIAREAVRDCLEELGGEEALRDRFRDQLYCSALELLQGDA